jgi:hypothetical protein
MTRQWTMIVIVAAVLLAAADEPKVGDKLIVTVAQTGVKPQKSRLTKDIATLKEGDEIVVDSVDPYWLGIKIGEATGYVLRSVVAPRGSIKLSTQAESNTVSTEEQTAAQRGFNPEVEKDYRKASSKELNAAFEVVDKIVARTTNVEELEKFAKDGRLVGENP